jgi:metal-dependent amidase/aminoacylase/carboxypeptidase family protein
VARGGGRRGRAADRVPRPAAHPTGNPTEGVDASLVQLSTALAVLRQRLPAGSHVQGIVTRGGEATNIVPDLAEGLRGLTAGALDDLVGQVATAARASPRRRARRWT